jgi:hypothetical protein
MALIEDRRYGAGSWRARGPAVLSGVFFAADLILWHHSIGDVGAGLATVLANVQVVLVPLVAWAVLAERPGRQVLAALPLALLGVLLISGALEHGAYGRDPRRGAVFGLAAGVAYVGFLLLLRPGGADLRRLAGPLFDATESPEQVFALGPDQRGGSRPIVARDVPLGAPDQHRGPRAVLGSSEIRRGSQLVGRRDPRRLQLPAGRVPPATPVIERAHTGAADRNVALPVPPRPPKRVGDQDRRRCPGEVSQLRSD